MDDIFFIRNRRGNMTTMMSRLCEREMQINWDIMRSRILFDPIRIYSPDRFVYVKDTTDESSLSIEARFEALRTRLYNRIDYDCQYFSKLLDLLSFCRYFEFHRK